MVKTLFTDEQTIISDEFIEQSASDEMILYWKFNNDVNDASGSNNNGIINGTPVYTLNRFAQNYSAIQLDGDAECIYNDTINYGDKFTVCMWIYPTDINPLDTYGRTIIASSPYLSSAYPIWILVDSHQIRVYAYSSAVDAYVLSVFNNIQINNWYHIAVSAIKGGDAAIYINGELDSVFTAGNQAPNNYICLGDLRLYRHVAFAGIIDDLRVYSKALSSEEINFIYKKGRENPQITSQSEVIADSLSEIDTDSGLVGYWRLNANAKDSSIYGQDGTIYGTSSSVDRFGQLDSSLAFGGVSSDYIDLGNPDQLKVIGDQTIMMWLRPHSFSSRCNPYNKSYGGEGTIAQEVTGQVNYYWGTSGENAAPYQGHISSFEMTLNQWNHITIVRNLSTTHKLRWYLNGKFSNERDALYEVATASNSNLLIGKGNAGAYDGEIYDVRVYNKALNDAEIANIYDMHIQKDRIIAEEFDEVGIDSDIQAWWPLDGHGKDISGNGVNGNMMMNPQPSIDRFGKIYKALHFSNGAYVDFGNDNNYDYTEFTVNLWAKYDTNDPANPNYPQHVTNIVGKGNWNQSNDWYIGFKSSTNLPATYISFVYGIGWNVGPSKSLSNLDISAWHMYTGVATATNLYLYIDGQLVDSKTASHGSVASTYPLQIARSSYSAANTAGIVDDVRIYNRALSEKEIKRLYLI